MNILETIIITIASGLIGGGISYYFAQKTENYKFSQLQRQKAEMVARYFAQWVKYQGNEKDFLSEKELITHYEELNRMSLELSLWIKDEKLLDEIMSRTQNKEGTANVRAIIGKIRKLILGIGNDKFNSQNITLWPKPEDAKKLFKL